MKGTPEVNRRAASATGAAAAALLAASVLLAGCSPSPSVSPSVTAPSTVSPTTTATPTPTPTPDSPEAKITAQIKAYVDFGNRVFADPSVSVNEAAKYLTDVDPDYVMTAVMRQILKFRDDGYKQTGTGTIEVTSVTPATAGAYTAHACYDNSQVVVTDSKGQTVNTGPARSAAVYNLIKGVDANWRISRIQGVGTC